MSYSGTVAGAIEGTILGIPSIALSQAFGPATREKPSYETPRPMGRTWCARC